MGFFNSPRSPKTSPVEQIESLNTRLEQARLIVTEGRIFRVLNKDSHYVVRAPEGEGFYVVNSEGCCNDGQHRVDLLEGYCEHRLAVNILNETHEAETIITSQSAAQGEAEARNSDSVTPLAEKPPVAQRNDSDTSPPAKPPVAQRNGKPNGTRPRKGAAEAIIAAKSLLQPVNGTGAKSNGAQTSAPESDPQ